MPENAKNPLRVNAFPPPQATTVVDLYEYRGDLNRLISQICEMTPAQLRTARFNADATAAVKAQRDDLRAIIDDFLRLAHAETNDPTQDATETLNHLMEWIEKFSEAYQRERKRPDVPAEEPQTNQGGTIQ